MSYKELLQENANHKAKMASLKGQLSKLVKLINGFKSERFDKSSITEKVRVVPYFLQ